MLYPNTQLYRKTPVVTYCGSVDNTATSLTALGADDPDRYVVVCLASGNSGTGTCSINGISTPIWYPKSNGTIDIVGPSLARFAVAKVPTGTSATFSYSGTGNNKTIWYTVTGLESTIPRGGGYDSGNPISIPVTMYEDGVVFGWLYSSNDNNSFTWSSGMTRTLNDTSLGASRGASAAFRQNTPMGAYTVTCSMGSGTMYTGVAVLR